MFEFWETLVMNEFIFPRTDPEMILSRQSPLIFSFYFLTEVGLRLEIKNPSERAGLIHIFIMKQI